MSEEKKVVSARPCVVYLNGSLQAVEVNFPSSISANKFKSAVETKEQTMYEVSEGIAKAAVVPLATTAMAHKLSPDDGQICFLAAIFEDGCRVVWPIVGENRLRKAFKALSESTTDSFIEINQTDTKTGFFSGKSNNRVVTVLSFPGETSVAG